MHTFTPVERLIIRYAAEDHAAHYYGTVFGFGRDDAARYTAEGHLRALVSEYGLTPVHRALVEVLTERPELLTRSPAERAAGAQARAAQADAQVQAAGKAFKAGDLERASKLIDDAETFAPARNFDGYREKIAAAKATAAAPAAPLAS
ncbi:Uncharacterised protein [Nocardia otitidiscaviarum]|uniref:Uncharacterized protein n=1 Tax=Nocardia otitidiscaviarum TaxID=1823 RepID=A0A379JM73_9NOCA|nr:hypothetical protein [Nocardia otitidiscaviarum]SUD49530.1 Uncharacterised protein [Nocardia otitidiscaviarum]